MCNEFFGRVRRCHGEGKEENGGVMKVLAHGWMKTLIRARKLLGGYCRGGQVCITRAHSNCFAFRIVCISFPQLHTLPGPYLFAMEIEVWLFPQRKC